MLCRFRRLRCLQIPCRRLDRHRRSAWQSDGGGDVGPRRRCRRRPRRASSAPPGWPTVNNIDWPSRPGLPVADQRREIVAICDRAAELKLNCLIVQVRTTCDALYPSRIEPWSAYLTGIQGQPPVPYYDPLAGRGSTSVTPGRSSATPGLIRIARGSTTVLRSRPSHVAKTNPAIVKAYGEMLWLDPGEPFAARRSLDVHQRRRPSLRRRRHSHRRLLLPVSDRRSEDEGARALSRTTRRGTVTSDV